MTKHKVDERWMTAGWVLLLLGGMAHMLPVQMEPLFRWGMYGVTLQMAVGVLSIFVALYYLLGNEE